ncbi:hypothetical protein DKL61_07675 [Gammaproteobacteria bacterium ESL0073]|nr:hypothetical protein DKL61_07675 [Gammaproteobacteria bacterium ESL0073]
MKRVVCQISIILSSILITACASTQTNKTTASTDPIIQPTYPIVTAHFDKYAKKMGSIIETQDRIIYYDANDQELKRENKVINKVLPVNNLANTLTVAQTNVQETTTPLKETIDKTSERTVSSSTNNYVVPKKSEYYSYSGATGIKVATVEETPTETKYYNYKDKLSGSKVVDGTTTTYYNKKGHEVASREETLKGANYYNHKGKKIGSEKTKKDTTYYYDGHGNFTGAEKQYKKGSIYYNKNGQVVGSTYTKGNKTYQLDSKGAIIGVKKRK